MDGFETAASGEQGCPDRAARIRRPSPSGRFRGPGLNFLSLHRFLTGGRVAMDEWYLDLFVGEVQRQANFGLIAFLDLQDALSNRKVDKIWYSTQGLLVAAG